MSAPTRNEPGLSRREEMSVSSAAMSGAPWKAAGAAGVAAQRDRLIDQGRCGIGRYCGTSAQLARRTTAYE